MSKHIAAFISYLFHPLLFPTYGVLLIIAANPHLFAVYPLKAQLLWVIITFVFTFLCPVIWLVIMKRLELISDFKMANTNDRIIPYIAVATFYMWMFKLFKPTNEFTPYSNQLISLMMLGASLSIFIGFFINIFHKISIHAIGMGSLAGLTLCMIRISDYDLKFFLVFVILFSGLVGTAQLIRYEGKANEVWMGYITGFTGQFFSFILIQIIIGS
jgi:hypothetical protein